MNSIFVFETSVSTFLLTAHVHVCLLHLLALCIEIASLREGHSIVKLARLRRSQEHFTWWLRYATRREVVCLANYWSTSSKVWRVGKRYMLFSLVGCVWLWFSNCSTTTTAVHTTRIAVRATAEVSSNASSHRRGSAHLLLYLLQFAVDIFRVDFLSLDKFIRAELQWLKIFNWFGMFIEF